jgi:hypothetical protein
METHTRLKPELVRSRNEMAFLLSESGLRDFIRDAAVHTNTAGRAMHSKRTDSLAL